MSDQLPVLSLLALFLAACLAAPASAQEVLVGQSDTVRVTNGGVWHLQGATMDFGGPDTTAALVETDSARVTGGLLTATRTLNGPSSADPAGLGAVLSADADLGDVTVTRGHTVQTASNGNESIKRYYDLSATGTKSGLSATLTQRYKDPELNTLSESTLEMFKSDDGGSTWSGKGADNRDETNNTVTLNGISSFSRWTLASSSNPLPVEMARFEATRAKTADSKEAVRLTWQTASEQGNAGFRVERARAQKREGESAWTEVGFVEGSGTTAEAQTYRFTDADLPYAADTLEYRLRQVDTDGSTTVTDPVLVAREGVKRLQLKKTFPNPARTHVTVQYAVPEDADAESVRMRLYDVLGRQVQSITPEATAGRHERQLSVSDLASGVYFLRLRADGTTQTRRLTVVK